MRKEPKYPRGTKVVLEVGEIHTHYDDNGTAYNMYRMKGFRSLCLDDKGMDIAMAQNKREEPSNDIEEWLDELIALQDILVKVGRKLVDSGIDVCDAGAYSYVHLYKGFSQVAEALGADVTERHITYNDGSETTEYSFWYKGKKIMQLGGDDK